MTTVPVIILAGSRLGEREPLALYGHVSHKALLPVGGKAMIERVVGTLEKTKELDPLWVSIEKPDCLAFLGNRIKIIKAASTPSESVFQALQKIGSPCLVTTADHALLRPEWVEEFILKSRKSDADVTAGIASAKTIRRDVPETKRTYIKLSDISFSGCNLFWMNSPKALKVAALWRKLQQNRKRPLKMALTLGFTTLFKALIRRLSTKDIEARIYHLTGASVSFILMSDGRAAVDVDKISDLKLAEQLLSKF
ncbi:nucleotidyltransferase family protein [Acetobacteraceae bacterium ESL0709]|nr:nucleotidyltransferase family protein [Acetobacteraceae bacterium ESL0697]MDF7678191.1 nucleotidyltransferase family protein [Acetobacteraceae bacterium ESL0709]